MISFQLPPVSVDKHFPRRQNPKPHSGIHIDFLQGLAFTKRSAASWEEENSISENQAFVFRETHTACICWLSSCVANEWGWPEPDFSFLIIRGVCLLLSWAVFSVSLLSFSLSAILTSLFFHFWVCCIFYFCFASALCLLCSAEFSILIIWGCAFFCNFKLFCLNAQLERLQRASKNN